MQNTSRLEILPLTEDLIEQLRIERNKKEVWKYLSNSFLINVEDQKRWFIQQSTDGTKQYFSILWNKKFVGCVWYDDWDRINRSCRIGITVFPKYWKKGIGFNTLKKFIIYLFNDLNIHRIWFLVMEENIHAIKLYKKLGFSQEGTQHEAIYRNGYWNDYIMMSLIHQDE